jgi:hypothetical protein
MKQDVCENELASDAIERRFRWARAQGHPKWLWPDVSPAEWRVAMSELERVTKLLLAGERPVRLAAADAPRLRALGIASYTSGLGPWLGWQVERGAVDADPNVGALLAQHLAHGRSRAARLDTALSSVLALLREHGIDATVLKGAHAAHVYFAQPGLRPMTDLDVLVSAQDIHRAERSLEANGYVQRTMSRLRKPHRSDWRPPGAPASLRSLTLTHAEDPFSVDLHGTLDIDFFGVRTIPFGQPAPAELAPARNGATSLRQPLLLVHHAAHASQGLHGLTLIRLLELILMIRRDVGMVTSWAEIVATSRRLGADRFIYPALALAEKLSPGTVDAVVLKRLADSSPPRLRGVVDALTPSTAQRLDGLALDERFMWSAGPIEHARRVLYMLIPTTSSLHGIAAIYAERAYRLLRGRVSWR